MRRAHGGERPGEPPFVAGRVPYMGAALEFGHDAHALLDRCRAEHGDVFTLYVAGERMTFVCDPVELTSVLRNKALRFSPIADEVMGTAFGLPIDRAEWTMLHEAEDLARSALKGDNLAPLTAGMEGKLWPRLSSRRSGSWEDIDLYRLVWETMFDAGTDALFGDGVTSEALARDFDAFDRAFPLLVAGLPKLVAREGAAGLERVVGSLHRLGSEPSRWMQERRALFHHLDPGGWGRIQSAVLWAIHANTIPATFWAVARLLADPVALAAIRAELAEHLGSPSSSPPDLPAKRLDELRLLDSAVREAMRLATGSLTVRRAVEATSLEVGGRSYAIREGDRVCLSPHFIHQDPEIHPDPATYRHDRFYTAKGVKTFEKRGRKVPLPFMPFGAGVSMCPGRFFAINEIKLFVALLLQTTEVEMLGALPAYDLSRVGLGIFPPATPHQVRLRAL